MISSFLLVISYVKFPDSRDALLGGQKHGEVVIENSGSLGLYYSGKCHKTYGNETITENEYTDWCSNIARGNGSQNPWIQYSLKGKMLRVNKYSIRNGCCRYYDCCCNDDGEIVDEGCCCRLYSYSLQASNDNITWTLLHSVKKDSSFYICEVRTFDLSKSEDSRHPYRYFRLVLDEELPGCPKCMQINQFELYGEVLSSSFESYSDNSDEDETISIIGRIKRGEN